MEIPRFCHRPEFGENPPIIKSIIAKRDLKLHGDSGREKRAL